MLKNRSLRGEEPAKRGDSDSFNTNRAYFTFLFCSSLERNLKSQAFQEAFMLLRVTSMSMHQYIKAPNSALAAKLLFRET